MRSTAFKVIEPKLRALVHRGTPEAVLFHEGGFAYVRFRCLPPAQFGNGPLEQAIDDLAARFGSLEKKVLEIYRSIRE